MKKFFTIILFLLLVCITQKTFAYDTENNLNYAIRDDLIRTNQDLPKDTMVTPIEPEYNDSTKSTLQNLDNKKNNNTTTEKSNKNSPSWWRQRGSYFGLGHIFD